MKYNEIKLSLPVKYAILNGYVVTRAGADEYFRNVYYVGNEKEITIVTQPFGENFVDFYKKWGMDGHDGIDWMARVNTGTGTCIYSMYDGVVTGVNDPIGDNRYDSNRWGHITLQHKKSSINFSTIYGHISDSFVKVGDKIQQGQLIGLSGNTGKYTTAPHLHTYFYETDVSGNVLNLNNGYKGGIDHANMFFETPTAKKSDNLKKLRDYFVANKIWPWRSYDFNNACKVLGIEGITRSHYYNFILKGF